MALGVNWFKEKYKEKTIDELRNLLKQIEESKNYPMKEKMEAAMKNIDDNDFTINRNNKIEAIEELIKEKSN